MHKKILAGVFPGRIGLQCSEVFFRLLALSDRQRFEVFVNDTFCFFRIGIPPYCQSVLIFALACEVYAVQVKELFDFPVAYFNTIHKRISPFRLLFPF